MAKRRTPGQPARRLPISKQRNAQMKNTTAVLLMLAALLPGCAGLSTPKELPVAAMCPPPPPVPAVLMDLSVSTQPSLAPRVESIETQLDERLTKARR